MARTASALRGHILEAALGLFVIHGYRGTSLHDIASEAGCSKASLLYHFASKDAILTELLTPAGLALNQLDQDLAGLSGDQAVEAAVTGYVDLALRYRREVKLLFSDLPEMLNNSALSGIPGLTERLLAALAGHSEEPEAVVGAWMVIGAVFVTSASDVPVPQEVLRTQMIRSALRALDHHPG
ncbi:TetR/AcrR family transcriptional regulator [Streptomyces olivaceiscleroticus]|uniref:HTH tetR-type domain-containing protein n=1 Tax=Streptomyces olivaceiscleroticus TaxID=68245 RepID=A0ABN1A2K6_9ACTN